MRSLGVYPFLPPVSDYYYGSEYSSEHHAWASQFHEWLRERVQTQHFHVRPPGHEYSVLSMLNADRPANGADDWHQDSVSGLIRNTVHVGVWANTSPTLIRLKDQEEVFAPQPFEVLLFENWLYEHRPPNMTRSEAKHRWFVRFYTGIARRKQKEDNVKSTASTPAKLVQEEQGPDDPAEAKH